jgi:PKD repeat protein
VCSNGFCTFTCADECTAVGARKCDGNAVVSCGLDGNGCLAWGSPVPCAEGLVCSSGACATQCTSECTVLGAAKCDEAGNVVECVDAGGDGCLKWGTPSACPVPQVCAQGSCALACGDECDGKGLKRCAEGVANKFQVCDEWDGDGCLEWGTTAYCSVTQACSNGACAEVPPPAIVLISEILYDSASTPDEDAFLELWGPPGLSLTGYGVVGVNGYDGKDYKAIALTGMTIGDDGFFVIVNPAANAGFLAQADLLDANVDYQNSPDSVQVRWGAQVVDALAYGSFSASEHPAGEGTPAAKTSAAGRSLARDEDETDTGNNAADFHELAVPTPGAPNLVPNAAPTAQLQCPAGGKVGDSLTFSGAASSDSDGSVILYDFDFGDGDTGSGTSATAQHVYADPGSYQVTLVVTDDRGATGQTTCGVAIQSVAGNQPPVALLACPDPPEGKVGQLLAFDASGSSDPDGFISSYRFDWGDGGVTEGNQATATAAYAEVGTYTVTLEVIDDQGATAQATCDVTIVPAGPADLTISASTELCGAHEYGKLVIQGGAKVTCASGALDVRASEVLIDPASSIDVSTSSGEGSGSPYNICSAACVCDYGYTGASGGGNGTKGTDSLSTAGDARSPEMGGCLGSCVAFGCSGRTGGPSRGLASELDAPLGGMGGTGCVSGFSSCSTPWQGGKGGGSVRLVATKSINIQGKILANGASGANASDNAWIGAGGGAGGSIVLAAPALSITGQLSAAGGAGGKGTKPSSYYTSNYAHGGAGGMGWIKLCHGPSFVKSGTLTGGNLVESVLPPLTVTSATHPNQALVYNDTFTQFDAAWSVPFPEATGYWYALGRGTGFVLSPSNGTYTAGTTASFPASAFTQAGAWALRVLAVDGSAVSGTVAARFDVTVNSTPHTVASSSHPDPAKWYTGTAVALSWTPPAGASAGSFPAFWYRVDRVSNTPATNAKASWTRTINPQVVVTQDSAGQALGTFAYYFHLVSEDSRGNLTRDAAHFRIQLGAEPAKVNFFGYVKSGVGAAIQGVKVRLEPYGLEQTTDVNGYFLFTGAYQGTYSLSATKEGVADYSTSVEVKEGASPFNVTMP